MSVRSYTSFHPLLLSEIGNMNIGLVLELHIVKLLLLIHRDY